MIRGGAFFRLLLFATLTQAIPLQRQIRSAIGNNTDHSMECISDDVVYHSGDQVPSPGPCEQCHCDPPNVICTMIKCKVNSGCKTIQRANHCCPDYKCECEYNGRVYNNGERLDRPDDPCQVCYCKGGEVMCTSVTCYEREDCKPHFVPGQCCPKYDHCPIESRRFTGNSIRSVNATAHGSKREMQPWLLTKADSVLQKQTTSAESSPQTKEIQTESTAAKVYPQTINIREILPTLSSAGGLTAPTVTILNTDRVTETSSSNVENEEENIDDEKSVGIKAATKVLPSLLGGMTINSHELVEETTTQSTQEEVFDLKVGFASEKELLNKVTHSGKNDESPTTDSNIADKTDGVSVDSKNSSEDEIVNSDEDQETRTESFVLGGDIESITPTSEITGTNKILRHVTNDLLSPVSTSVSKSDHNIQTTTENNYKSSEQIPLFDLMLDHHNTTGVPQITLPTSDTFITLNSDSSDGDSETTDYNIFDRTSTELLSGGVFEELPSPLPQNMPDQSDSSTDSTMDYSFTEGSTISTDQYTKNYENSESTEKTSTLGDLITHNNARYSPNFVDKLTDSWSTNWPARNSAEDEKNDPDKTTTESVLKEFPTTESSASESVIIERHTTFDRSEEKSEEVEETSDEGVWKIKEKGSSSRTDSESSSSSSDFSGEKTEMINENQGHDNDLTMPPILQLNDQIQYLKIGGHHEETESSTDEVKPPVIHVDIFNINSKSASCNVSMTNHKKNHVGTGDNLHDQLKVSHVVLSQSDLITLAELLMKKNVSVNNSLNKRNTPSPESSEESDSSERQETRLAPFTNIRERKEPLLTFSATGNETADTNQNNTKNALYFNSTEEKEKWAAEVINQVVTNIMLPITNVQLVEEFNDTRVNNQPVNNVSESEIPNSMSEEFTTLSSTDQTEEIFSEEMKGVENPTTEINHEDKTYSSDTLDQQETTERFESTTSEEDEVNFRELDKVREKIPSSEEKQEITETSSIDPNMQVQTSFTTKAVNNLKNNDAQSSRTVSIPDMEYLVQQFPSTLDERDILILKDFLKKHISVP